jgi:hypothetical protein
LIVDYIFDWARDIYREAIVGELRSLAVSNTISLERDSDVFSLEDHIAFLPQLPQVQELRDDLDEVSNLQDDLKTFDSPHGVLRDANYIRSRFMALHITEDNLSVLMDSIKTPAKARKAAENILRCLKDGWRVSREAIDALELRWTGKDRENMSLYSPDKVFLVAITVSAYLSPDWEQTRELCCLAVSEVVLDELFQQANLKGNQRSPSSDFPWIENDIFVSAFQMYSTMTVKDNLPAAISRASVSTKLFTEKAKTKTDEGHEQGTWWVKSTENISGSVKYRFDAAIMPDSLPYARRFVSLIYNLHKIGRNEPSSSILRISNRLDLQRRPNEGTSDSMWPCPDLPATLSDHEEGIIYVTSKTPTNVPQYAELCIFVMDASKITGIVDQNELEQPSNAFAFQAMRMDTKPGWGSGWNRSDVQTSDAGFLENKKRFLNHLISLEGFAKYRKGKAVERPAPPKTWKPKKKHSNYHMAMAEPPSLSDVLQFRDMMAKKGHRLTSITTSDGHSQGELAELAGLSPSLIPESGASATSDIPPTSESTGNGLSNFKQGSSNPEDSDPKIVGFVPERRVGRPNDSSKTNSGPRKGKALSVASKIREAQNDERLIEQDRGEGISVSGAEKTATLVLRGHGTKRFLDPLDMELASSSAGPSKRSRQETHLQFDNDHLNDETLNHLLETGYFSA